MSRKILILPLLLWAVVAMSEPIPSPVPAMIVYGVDGSRQVVRLETTDVTDLIVITGGFYYSTNPYDANYAFFFAFESNYLGPQYYGNRLSGQSIRLVRSVPTYILSQGE